MKSHPYLGETVYLATQHGKGRQIAPAFMSALQMKVEEVATNTDLLGTFSGEIERVGTPREVVLQKARLALEVSGANYALASEGSIGVDPVIPFINSDIELVAFIDKKLGFEIVETLRSTEIVAATLTVEKETDLSEFLRKADFPHHKVIVRSTDKPVAFCEKGISTLDELQRAIKSGLQSYPALVVESDLRAHCSPSRQSNIAAAAHKLALRLAQLCPACATPGWGITSYSKGLPCSECGEISHEALHSEILGCVTCSYTSEGKKLADVIEPAMCNFCNP